MKSRHSAVASVSVRPAAATLVGADAISFHVWRIYEKLEVHSTSEAVAKALKARLV